MQMLVNPCNLMLVLTFLNNVCVQEGGTALWLACHLGHTEMVRYMLSVCDKFDITATLQVTRMLAPLRLFMVVVLFVC